MYQQTDSHSYSTVTESNGSSNTSNASNALTQIKHNPGVSMNGSTTSNIQQFSSNPPQDPNQLQTRPSNSTNSTNNSNNKMIRKVINPYKRRISDRDRTYNSNPNSNPNSNSQSTTVATNNNSCNNNNNNLPNITHDNSQCQSSPKRRKVINPYKKQIGTYSSTNNNNHSSNTQQHINHASSHGISSPARSYNHSDWNKNNHHHQQQQQQQQQQHSQQSTLNPNHASIHSSSPTGTSTNPQQTGFIYPSKINSHHRNQQQHQQQHQQNSNGSSYSYSNNQSNINGSLSSQNMNERIQPITEASINSSKSTCNTFHSNTHSSISANNAINNVINNIIINNNINNNINNDTPTKRKIRLKSQRKGAVCVPHNAMDHESIDFNAMDYNSMDYDPVHDVVEQVVVDHRAADNSTSSWPFQDCNNNSSTSSFKADAVKAAVAVAAATTTTSSKQVLIDLTSPQSRNDESNSTINNGAAIDTSNHQWNVVSNGTNIISFGENPSIVSTTSTTATATATAAVSSGDMVRPNYPLNKALHVGGATENTPSKVPTLQSFHPSSDSTSYTTATHDHTTTNGKDLSPTKLAPPTSNTNMENTLSSSSKVSTAIRTTAPAITAPPAPKLPLPPPPPQTERWTAQLTRDMAEIPKELMTNFQSRTNTVNDKYRLKLIDNANLNGELKNGWKLLPHQKQGIVRGLAMRRLVLAYDMGLGKTLIGCVWAKAFLETFHHAIEDEKEEEGEDVIIVDDDESGGDKNGNRKSGVHCYIIAPVSMKEEWSKTLWEATGLKSEDYGKKSSEKKSKRSKEDGPKDQKKQKKQAKLKGKKKKKKKKSSNESSLPPPINIEICSWSKVPKDIPSDIKHYIVICDEAHYLQSMESTRTKDTLSLVLHDRCIGTLLLTGTPMKNGKPVNLFPLLKAIRHPFGDDYMTYTLYFCNGQQKKFRNKIVWDGNGSSNLGLLRTHIKMSVLYKTKKDCLKSLPPKTREIVDVPVPSRYEIQHSNAMRELAKAMESADKMKAGEDSIAHENMITAFTRLRQIASRAKVDATVAQAQKILKEEGQVVIFTYFVDVAKSVYEQLYGLGWESELLSGATPSGKRQSLVDNFQSGVSAAFVATFGAGGVGITLTAARTIILLDRPWTPGDAAQAEDRVRRIGQKFPVKSLWMRSFQVDTQIDNLIEEKSMTSTAIVDRNGQHDTNMDEYKSAPKISLRRLIKSIVTENTETLSNPMQK